MGRCRQRESLSDRIPVQLQSPSRLLEHEDQRLAERMYLQTCYTQGQETRIQEQYDYLLDERVLGEFRSNIGTTNH